MYFALSFVRLMVGDAGRSGQGEFRCRSGARDVRAHRDASRTAPGRRDGPGAARSRRRRGVRKAPIFFTTWARLRQKTRPRNGTRDAPQLRQPLPRRRPAVHVQHEVDDRDVMTDLGRRPHRSTRFPRPRPMEKNNGLTQHASRNSVPALEIGDPGGRRLCAAVPNGTARLVGELRMEVQSKEIAQKHCRSVPAFQRRKKGSFSGRFIMETDRNGRTFWSPSFRRGGRAKRFLRAAAEQGWVDGEGGKVAIRWA